MTSLRNVAAIVEKEWRHYFGSPIAYVSLTVWALLFGIFFYFAFSFFLRESMMAAQQMEFGGGPKMSLNEWVIRPLFKNMAVVALFITPMITMRLFAEEKRSGTMELLMTSPVRDWEIILGKWIGAMLMYLCVIGISALNITSPGGTSHDITVIYSDNVAVDVSSIDSTDITVSGPRGNSSTQKRTA